MATTGLSSVVPLTEWRSDLKADSHPDLIADTSRFREVGLTDQALVVTCSIPPESVTDVLGNRGSGGGHSKCLAQALEKTLR